jgi:diaminopimelate epimerase
LRLTKHHGLANDFLIVLDELNPVLPTIDGDLARRLCDRRTGIGADGLIHGATSGRPELGVVMRLFNADGSRAEMSGNGVRCLAQAVALARDDRSLHLVVDTDAGARAVNVDAPPDSSCAWVTVDMGPAKPGPDIPESVRDRVVGRCASVDLGNPHLVVDGTDPNEADLAGEGRWIESQFAGGVNVEYIAPRPDIAGGRSGDGGADGLTMTVWERGAGITQACGTGACAAAFAAQGWGLVGDVVEVHMPGGAATVTLGDTITLAGPSTLVATVEVDDG